MKEYCAGQMVKVDWLNGNPEGHSEHGLVDQGVQYLDSSPLQSARDQLVQSQPLCVVGLVWCNEERVTVVCGLHLYHVVARLSLDLACSNPLILRYRCCVTKNTFDISTFTIKSNHIKRSYSTLCLGQQVLLPTT
jgi:hypothetical protein